MLFFRRLTLAFSLFFLLVGCAPATNLLPAASPPGETTASGSVSVATPTAGATQPGPVPASTPTPRPAAEPAILETRRLTVEWPAVIRLGDAEVVRLRLEVDESGTITPTAEYAGNVVSGRTIEVPDVFATHTVQAEARLDLAGVQISPEGLTTEALLPGRSVTFYWSVRPQEVGRYRGTVWFFLRFVPLAGGAESRSALAAMPIEINVISFLGLPAGPARWLGAIGSFVGGVLGFPFFEDVVRPLFKRRRRKRSSQKDDKNNTKQGKLHSVRHRFIMVKFARSR